MGGDRACMRRSIRYHGSIGLQGGRAGKIFKICDFLSYYYIIYYI